MNVARKVILVHDMLLKVVVADLKHDTKLGKLYAQFIDSRLLADENVDHREHDPE